MGSSTERECASAGWKHGLELDVQRADIWVYCMSRLVSDSRVVCYRMKERPGGLLPVAVQVGLMEFLARRRGWA